MQMTRSNLDKTYAKVANDFRNLSFENHMSLYASHDVLEAAQRARLLQHFRGGEPVQQRDVPLVLRIAALVAIITSLSTILFNQLS
jgi:hypothetical protein